MTPALRAIAGNEWLLQKDGRWEDDLVLLSGGDVRYLCDIGQPYNEISLKESMSASAD